jgi:Domain of unknown function (DUF4936)
MNSGRRQLFIYYRLKPGNEAAVMQQVIEAQRLLMQEVPGLRAVCLRRPPLPGTPVTLMETYAIDACTDPDGVSPETEAAVERAITAQIGSFIDGPRHVEIFEACV